MVRAEGDELPKSACAEPRRAVGNAGERLRPRQRDKTGVAFYLSAHRPSAVAEWIPATMLDWRPHRSLSVSLVRLKDFVYLAELALKFDIYASQVWRSVFITETLNVNEFVDLGNNFLLSLNKLLSKDRI